MVGLSRGDEARTCNIQEVRLYEEIFIIATDLADTDVTNLQIHPYIKSFMVSLGASRQVHLSLSNQNPLLTP